MRGCTRAVLLGGVSKPEQKWVWTLLQWENTRGQVEELRADAVYNPNTKDSK